jgi:hypothetical protein
MEILNSLVSVKRLLAFIEKHNHEHGIVYVMDTGQCGDDKRLVFVNNKNRHHHMTISDQNILELSHTVPGLQYRAPGFENEPLHYHADRVKAYVMSHGYYVWGSGNDFAEWVCFVRADEVDDATSKHYSVPQDHIDILLQKPRCMTHGYKLARKERVFPGSDANKDADQ